MHPGNIPRLDELGMDFRVFGFALAISILTGVVFGLAPALRASRLDLNSTLKSGGRASSGSGLSVKRDRLRGALVIAELAISLPLLAGAGLLVRSFVHLLNVPPGFTPANVISMQVSAEGPRYQNGAQIRLFYKELEEGVRRLPGVTSVGAVTSLPLTPSVGWGGLDVEGYVPPANQPELQVDKRGASADYFKTMEIPLAQGRWFTPAELIQPTPVVIVDAKLAQRFWPNGNAIGKHIRGGSTDQWRTIVGVVGVVKEYGLDVDTRMVMYFPAHGSTSFLVARTNVAPATMADAIVHQVHALDADVPVYNIATMDSRLQDSLARQRFAMTMLAAFAGFAMILAAIGLYGVLSFLVSQGTPEIAIRMALGAQRSRILSLVFRQGMGLALAGLAVGLAATFALTRLMAGLLFGVSAYDPTTFLAVVLLLAAVALAACYFPARRAMRVEPMAALRAE
jgi:predicted permease